MCGALLGKFAAFRDRCLAAKRVVEVALARLHYRPISTNLIRSVDRVAHKLVLDFTLGLDAKVIPMYHDDRDDDLRCIINYEPARNIIDDIDDGLTDVLNDFEEIRNSLNEVDNIGFNEEFNDLTQDNFEASSFNEHVDRLLRGKEMNTENTDFDDLIKKTDFNVKSIDNGVKDINTGFLGKNMAVKKALEDSNMSKEATEDDSNDFSDAEDFINANINNVLPEVLNFNDVSINTTDLNDNDNSNLVETFNEFILDDLDDKFLMEPDTELNKKKVTKVISDVQEEAKEPPETKKRDKLQLMKEVENKKAKRRAPMKPRKKEIRPIEIKEETPRPKKNLKELIAAIDEEYKAKRLTQNHLKKEKENTEDFIKFGGKYNFRVFVLTEEEQLEELEQKREGDLYKNAPYKCELCAKGFRSEETHQNHLQVHKISHGLFECGICHSRHKTDARRKRHANTHRLKFCCTHCEFVARSREKAEAHYEWHVGKTYSCPYCGEISGKLSTHLSHVRLQHPGACVACERCGESFVGNYGLKLHMRRIHSAEEKSDDRVELYCFPCRTQFNNREARARHEAAGPRCRPGSWPCAECGENFESVPALLLHRRARHGDAPLKCELCDATFTNVVSRETHFDRVHLQKPKKRDTIPPVKKARSTVRRVMCETCGNKYHSPAALAYHQRSHSGERPFPCPRCPKSFGHAHTLQAHIRTHTGERPYRCAECPRAFPTSNNLRRHIKIEEKSDDRVELYCFPCRTQFNNREARARHEAAGPRCRPGSWPCAECGENLESVPALLLHRRARHGDAPLKCELCDATFTNVVSRETHFDRVHLQKPKKRDTIPPVKKARSTVRRVMCETCGNKYHSPAALAYHQRSHSGERPFPCPRCPKSFGHAHTLQAHIRTHTGERPYRCAECPRAFPTSNNLRRHIKIVHHGEGECVRCAQCGVWLSSPAAARAHSVIHARGD